MAKKLFVVKKSCVQQIFWPKKILGPKKFESQKWRAEKYEYKKYKARKIFESKTF